MAQNGPKQSEMFRKMFQLRQEIPTSNCPTENAEKLLKKILKMAKITQKYPKMVPKLCKMFQQMVQMRPEIPTPISLTENGEKLAKNYQKWPT